MPNTDYTCSTEMSILKHISLEMWKCSKILVYKSFCDYLFGWSIIPNTLTSSHFWIVFSKIFETHFTYLIFINFGIILWTQSQDLYKNVEGNLLHFLVFDHLPCLQKLSLFLSVSLLTKLAIAVEKIAIFTWYLNQGLHLLKKMTTEKCQVKLPNFTGNI